jgi:hypothetical protein
VESEAGRTGPPPSTREAEHVEGPTSSSEARRGELLEFFTSVLAAFAVILTAYSAYEATRWSGVQATDFATAGSLRTQATSLTTIGTTQVSYDANVVADLLLTYRDADFSNPQVRAQALEFADTLFRDEAKPALEEWLSLDPGNNPDAPDTPLDVPSYHNANLDQADQLVAEAEQVFQSAKQANQNGDDYILATILFASVLFFTGLRIKSTMVRGLVEAFATLCLLGGIVRLLTLPFQ